MANSKEQEESSSKPVNYTLFNQKITFEFLKAHLWTAADILRGSLDTPDYRQPIMTLLFIKRLNDTFEETTEKIIKEDKSEKEALCQTRSCSQKETCNRNKNNFGRSKK